MHKKRKEINSDKKSYKTETEQKTIVKTVQTA